MFNYYSKLSQRCWNTKRGRWRPILAILLSFSLPPDLKTNPTDRMENKSCQWTLKYFYSRPQANPRNHNRSIPVHQKRSGARQTDPCHESAPHDPRIRRVPLVSHTGFRAEAEAFVHVVVLGGGAPAVAVLPAGCGALLILLSLKGEWEFTRSPLRITTQGEEHCETEVGKYKPIIQNVTPASYNVTFASLLES